MLSQGVPHPWPRWDWGTPPSGTVVPPSKGPGTLHWGTSWKGHGTSGSIMGWRWGTPFCVNRQTPVKT